MAEPLLLIAQSARALAAAAVRAGHPAVAVDMFADEDTAALAVAERIDGGLACGFRRRPLLAAVDRALARVAERPTAVVLGSGFEDRPRLMARIGDRFDLLGPSAGTVALVKNPERLAALAAALAIPHPPVARAVPAGGDWLVKRRGGTGGAHVRPGAPGPVPAGCYAQRRVCGSSVSVLGLADRAGADVLAYSEQWADPLPEAPFRFAGVVGPVAPPAADAAIRAALADLARRSGLRGLFSLDLMIDGPHWWLLEVNPRPGASLDALDRFDIPLLAAHVEACRGRRPVVRRTDATIRATMVVHAPSDSLAPPGAVWPSHVMDRPAPGSRIGAGAPIATVIAAAGTAGEARRLAEERARNVIDMTGKRTHD